MIFLFYILGYYAIGLLIMGPITLRQWWFKRNFVSPESPRHLLFIWAATGWLWPLVVFVMIRHGLPKFEDTEDNPAGRLRKRQRDSRRDFARKIPPCGSVIRMTASNYPGNLESAGVFYFESEAAWQEMSKRVNSCPSLQNDDEGQLLKWLALRQKTDSPPTDVPIGFERFSVCANKLIREGLCQAECVSCKKTYPVQRLTFRDDAGSQKSYFQETLCPNGHVLLKELRLRFF